MAGLTRDAVGVLIRHHLREVFGPRRTGRMAPHAQHRGVELGRRHRGIGGVRCQRTVTSFAIHPFVLALVFQAHRIGVARFAGFVPGEFRRMGRDLVHGGSTIVPVPAEGFGDYIAANGPEHDKSHNKQAGETEKMSCISESVHERPSFPGWQTGNLARRLM